MWLAIGYMRSLKVHFNQENVIISEEALKTYLKIWRNPNSFCLYIITQFAKDWISVSRQRCSIFGYLFLCITLLKLLSTIKLNLRCL